MSEAAIIGARLLQYGAALVLFGSSLFCLYGLNATGPWQRPLLIAAATIAIAASVVGLLAQTAALTGDPRDALRGTVLWSVITDTRFAKFGVLRISLLLLALVALCTLPFSRNLMAVSASLGAAVVASFGWSGHAASQQGLPGLLHLASDVLHLLAAGVWIGALVAITRLLLQRQALAAPSATRVVGDALGRFSGVGPAVVAILILTGLVNSAFLIDRAHWLSSLQTPYGTTLLIKLALFAAMLMLAALNRFRLTPALISALSSPASLTKPVRQLHISLLTETLLALLVIAAVAVLGTLAPPV